tara:strand:+ start:87 stop:368 length:282 start_codon:yes stop_codon:yes gene_type:complete
MAKRKTPKVKDLKPKQLTTQELKSLQDLVNTINRAQLEVGGLESRKHSLLHQVAGFQGQLQELQKGFEDTYGKADINITDGVINYVEDEQVNS